MDGENLMPKMNEEHNFLCLKLSGLINSSVITSNRSKIPNPKSEVRNSNTTKTTNHNQQNMKKKQQIITPFHSSTPCTKY